MEKAEVWECAVELTVLLHIPGQCCSLGCSTLGSAVPIPALAQKPLQDLLWGSLINAYPCSVVQEEEFYVCIYAAREGDYVLFHHEGGVDVGDVDAKAQKLLVAVDEKISESDVKKHLLQHAPANKKE